MNYVRALILFSLLAITLPFSTAQADLPAFGSCLTDSLTGKERKLLARWIFFAIAVHPEMKDYSSVAPEQRISTDKAIGELVTRLFVEDCPQEARAAQAADPMAINKAFELVGQVAMQELMNNEGVMRSISNYGNYADQAKINAVFSE